MIEIEEIREKLCEIEKNLEGIATRKADLKGKMEQQEGIVKIIKMLAYNKVEKMPEKTRENKSGEIEITYREEKTTLIAQMELLGDLKRQYAIAEGAWASLIERKWILMSLLGYDKALAGLMTS